MTDYLADFDPATQEPSDDYDSTEDLSTPDLLSFDIGLSPTGDEGAAFRTQNDPYAPFQRSNYIERKGAIDIRCTCVDVIHGLFSASSATPATLLVLQFRFDARKRARRFESVDISLQFGSMTPGESGPEVYAIAPDDRMSLVPTTQHEERKRNAGLQVGGAAPVGGVTA